MRAWARNLLKWPAVASLLVNHVFNQLGGTLAAVAALAWLAVREPRHWADIAAGTPASTFPRWVFDYGARLLWAAAAITVGLRVNETSDLLWAVPVVICAAYIILNDPTHGFWTRAATISVGLAIVATTTVAFDAIRALIDRLESIDATWSGLSVAIMTAGMTLVGGYLILFRASPRVVLTLIGTPFAIAGAVSTTLAALEANGSTPSSTIWGTNDHHFAGIFTIAGGAGMVFLALAVVAHRRSVQNHASFCVAALLAGGVTTWVAGLQQFAVATTAASLALGLALSVTLTSRRARLVFTSVLLGASLLVALIPLCVSASQDTPLLASSPVVGGVAVLTVVTTVGWKVHSMTDADIAAMP
ncbi:hypothetical protein FDO65_16850 [Nakamurella flava]|uniref:Uncharacterized protein n=1 Tax=Nakamurella flava TaxID=2576308 RepID=A0A4U6QCL7_9ACTN|nr:hypothetical protein [Nakamurella flava]TKV57803.1 hypothetical protein FDO65_16850 [Nakamurella flava]